MEMSFIVAAIYNNTQLYVAADGRATDENDVVVDEDVQKIYELSSHFVIGAAGNHFDTHVVMEIFQKEYKPSMTFDECIQLLQLKGKMYDTACKRRGMREPHGRYILCGYDVKAPRIFQLSLDGDRVLTFEGLLSFGKYQVSTVNPYGCRLADLQKPCQQLFEEDPDIDPRINLRRLVSTVSQMSQWVNDHVTVVQVFPRES